MRLVRGFLLFGLAVLTAGCGDNELPAGVWRGGGDVDFYQAGSIVSLTAGRMLVLDVPAVGGCTHKRYVLDASVPVVRADGIAGDTSALFVGARVIVGVYMPRGPTISICPGTFLAKVVQLY